MPDKFQKEIKQKQEEIENLGQDKIVNSMMKIFSKQNRNTPVDTKHPEFRRIFSTMIDFDKIQSKVKLEKHKVTRRQIKAYLLRRYDTKTTKIIMRHFKFNQQSSMEEFAHSIENFVSQDTLHKRKLGFELTDRNGDGIICPQDMLEVVKIRPDFGNLLAFDYMHLVHLMKKNMDIPEKPESAFYDEIREQFDQMWNDKVKQRQQERKRNQTVSPETI